jgi:nicotinamide phosphoribosyltransferase
MLELVKPFNIILWCDTYKFAHWEEIPFGVKQLVSAVVPRKPFYDESGALITDEIVAAGQTFIAHVFATARLEQWMIDEAEVEITEQGYNFNREGWEYILRTYGGRIPLTMFGVEEGRVVKPQTPILLVTNEDDEHTAWLVPYFEPVIQSVSWSMTYTATICRYMFTIMAYYVLLSGGNIKMLEYLIHNFGDRGADGPDETPVLKGIAHAMLFLGSDCGRANRYIKTLYNTSKAYTSSVEATEHTTVCLNSNAAARDDFGGMQMVMRRLKAVVERSKRGIGIPVISTVPDTYDDERFVTVYVAGFKVEIENSGGRLVIRPDSGIPKKKLPQVLGWLKDIFGVTVNEAGYQDLPWCIGALYGDGMNVNTFEPVVRAAVVDHKFSTNNFLLGMGAGITNEGSRDKLSFSMKTIAKRCEVWERVLKEPKSDMGKKSLSGLIRNRENENGELETFDALASNSLYEMFVPGPGHRRWLDKGYRDWRQSFDDTRANAQKGAIDKAANRLAAEKAVNDEAIAEVA